MNEDRTIVLTRDCDAMEIPGGDRLRLLKGSEVLLRRKGKVGFTLLTGTGILVSVATADADALGVVPGPERSEPMQQHGGGELEQLVWRELHEVYDPEIPVDIVELGLVYGCTLEQGAGGSRVEVRMTLTAPGCAVGGLLVEEIMQRIAALPGVCDADVQLVWEPPWTPERMSEAARVQLGLM